MLYYCLHRRGIRSLESKFIYSSAPIISIFKATCVLIPVTEMNDCCIARSFVVTAALGRSLRVYDAYRPRIHCYSRHDAGSAVTSPRVSAPATCMDTATRVYLDGRHPLQNAMPRRRRLKARSHRCDGIRNRTETNWLTFYRCYFLNVAFVIRQRMNVIAMRIVAFTPSMTNLLRLRIW